VGWRCLNWTFGPQQHTKSRIGQFSESMKRVSMNVSNLLHFGLWSFLFSSLVPLRGAFPLFIYLSCNSSEQSTCTQQTRVYNNNNYYYYFTGIKRLPRFPPRFVWIVESSQEQPEYEFLQILQIFIINLPYWSSIL